MKSVINPICAWLRSQKAINPLRRGSDEMSTVAHAKAGRQRRIDLSKVVQTLSVVEPETGLKALGNNPVHWGCHWRITLSTARSCPCCPEGRPPSCSPHCSLQSRALAPENQASPAQSWGPAPSQSDSLAGIRWLLTGIPRRPVPCCPAWGLPSGPGASPGSRVPGSAEFWPTPAFRGACPSHLILCMASAKL